MFGRTTYGYQQLNQQNPNSGHVLPPIANQQNNFINFQFHNQTYVNQYLPQQQQNYNYQQQNPNQMQQLNPQQSQINNLDDETPDFDSYLQQSEQYSENSLAKSSKNTYDKNLRVYQSVMEQFKREPYPITIEKLKVFLTFQAHHGMTINTLKSYITGLSFYFKSKDLPNLTLTNEFKKFKSGLQRAFKEDSSPFAKLPFKTEFFLQYLQIYDMNDIENIRMIFYMTLSFYGFLRISELLNLRKKDIVYDVQQNKLILNIRYSKTDQNGNGVTTYLYNNQHKVYHPLNFIHFIQNLNDDDLIVNISEDLLRKRLNDVLNDLKLDTSKYSWHSFRRGGATLASQNHIDPAIIKAHGRWLSDAYLLYVDQDQDRAGLQISDVL